MSSSTSTVHFPKGKRKINLTDLPKRMSVKDFQQKLLNTREEPWKVARQLAKTLKYKVDFGITEGKEEFVRNCLKGNDSLHLNNKLAGAISVMHGGDTTRINCPGKSVLGTNYSLIKSKEQGSLYIDHGTRSYLHIPKEIEAQHAFTEKFIASVKVTKAGKDGMAQAVISVDAPFRIRYELTLNTDPDYADYRREIICYTIGCPEVFASSGVNLESIFATGFPVRGSLYMIADGSEYELISSFRVTGLQWAAYDAKEFAAPAGYKSIKELSRQAKDKGKKTAFAPAIRLSEARARYGKYPAPNDHFAGDMHEHEPATGDQQPQDSVLTSSVNKRFEGGGLKFPTCFDNTYASLIANVVDQKLLDDLKYLVNGITKRLDDFSGSNGNLTINWMDQFKAHSDALSSGDPGGGLYVMMHDETAMGPGYTMKRGLLDKLAVKDLGNLLADGNNLADIGLPAAVQTNVNNIIANTGIAASNRFSSLSLEDQGVLIDSYVFNRLGTIPLTYPSSTGTQRIFHNLLDVRLDNIDFDININNSAVVDTLVFDNSSVHLILKLPDASGSAFLSRWPAPLYWAILAASGIACFFFPPACALAAAAILVGLFVALDFAFVSIDLENIEIDAHLTWVPNGSNVLQPQVTLQLDADVTVYYISVVPTGVHQILSLIYSIVLSTTDIVIDQIESQLQDKLNDFLKNDLEISYPPKFGPVPLTGISNTSEFVSSDRMYVEQGLNAGTLGVICPFITQVDAEVKSKILKLRDEFKATFEDPVAAFTRLGGLLGWAGADFTNIARYYAGTVLSQNFINHYIYTLWRTQRFNYDFTTEETEKLFHLLREAFPQFRNVEYDPRTVRAHLWPAVPPRTVFTPKPASENKFYSTTFFDDVRICFELAKIRIGKNAKLEILFSAQAFTEIGFGGFNSATNQLDIIKVNDRVFDLYFDLTKIKVSVIHPEVHSFRFPAMPVTVAQDYSPLDHPSLKALLVRAMSYALKNRNAAFIPRGASDNAYIQRYPIGDNAVQLVCQLVPFQGNMYVSKGLSGVATVVYEGALDIDQLDKNLALFIRALI
ncbi:MAG: hypothetical protein QM781_16055 [Chitinophagaceae bacterium]